MVGSISAAPLGADSDSPRAFGGVSAGSFPPAQLEIDPMLMVVNFIFAIYCFKARHTLIDQRAATYRSSS